MEQVLSHPPVRTEKTLRLPGHWPPITPQTLYRDFLAGLTGAVLVLPQGVAFATIAGMPPEYGLYAGIVPAIVAALAGSSWHLVSGPTTAASIVLFSVLSPLAEPGSIPYVQLALTLTFLVGVMELALGAARLGGLVNFISHSVVTGFTAGAALLIATSQLSNLTGVPIPRGTPFFQAWEQTLTHLADANPAIAVIAFVTIAASLLCQTVAPRLPHLLIAMIAGGLTARILPDQGFPGSAGITALGALPSTLPPLSLPDFSPETLSVLFVPALAVTFLALTEAISIARAMAGVTGQKLDGNREFIGQGLSNLVGCFFSAYVATGSFNRSGLNLAAGAKSPLAAAISGVLLLLLLLLAAPLARFIPHAAMAGVLFIVAANLMNPRHILHILKSDGHEAVILVTTFAATLVLHLEEAILLGVLVSLFLYLRQTARPRILDRVPDPTAPTRRFVSDPQLPRCPQLTLLRIDGSLFFGAVPHVQKALETLARPGATLAILASGINFVDLTGAEFLAREAQRWRKLGGRLVLVQVKQPVLADLREKHLLEEIGEENIFTSKHEALAALVPGLDQERCQVCRARIFQECPADREKQP